MTLRLGGFVAWSSVDYPGHQAAVVFVSGCPWRCAYCHNSHLWDAQPPLLWSDVYRFLELRRGLLDAVVISGGEPLAQSVAVEAALIQIRALGFGTALHTAGISGRRLAPLLAHLDWVGLDMKGPFSRYDVVTKRRRTGESARRCLHLLLDRGTPHQLRTTVHPELLSAQDLVLMVKDLVAMGAYSVVLKNFRPNGCMDSGLTASYRPWLTPALTQELRALMPAIVLPDP